MKAWKEYLDSLNDEQRSIVEKVLDTAMLAAPDAVAEMPYGVPGLKLAGKPLIAVAAHKQHYGVYPFSRGVIEAVRPLLGDLETAKGTIRFGYDEAPSDELVQKLVELRSREIL